MTVVTTDRIMMVWRWCCDAYSQRGRRLSFPDNTDPTKTYQWRYLEALAKKLAEWQFDDETCRRFINVAVAYAKERKLLSKGLAIFFQGNLLQVCLGRLQQEQERTQAALDALASVNSWVAGQCRNRPLLDTLLARSGPGAYSNIVRWYQAGNITDLYLTLSQTAMAALARLAKQDPQERKLLPAATKLWLIRSSFLQDVGVVDRAKTILSDDWRQMCL